MGVKSFGTDRSIELARSQPPVGSRGRKEGANRDPVKTVVVLLIGFGAYLAVSWLFGSYSEGSTRSWFVVCIIMRYK